VAGFDQDAADAGALTYLWNASTPAAVTTAFAVDATTGAITVKPGLPAGALNFEGPSPVFTGFVAVRDTTLRTDSAVVTIWLTDVNEAPAQASPPLADVFGTPVAGPLAVSEAAPAGTVLGSLRMTDPDAGAAGVLSYALVGSVDACAVPGTAIFGVTSANGTLYVAAPAGLDWEDCTAYTLTINVTDGGVPQRWALATASIAVRDAADARLSAVRLATGEEAAGRGGDLQDQFSVWAGKFAALPSTVTLNTKPEPIPRAIEHATAVLAAVTAQPMAV
jgi:hypothetical protein